MCCAIPHSHSYRNKIEIQKEKKKSLNTAQFIAEWGFEQFTLLSLHSNIKKYPEILNIFLYLESRILQSSFKERCSKAQVNILFGL